MVFILDYIGSLFGKHEDIKFDCKIIRFIRPVSYPSPTTIGLIVGVAAVYNYCLASYPAGLL